MTTKSYYDILGVGQDASDDEIKKAYRQLAIKWHPDKHAQDTEAQKKIVEDKFKDINRAYEVLGDSDKRKSYDSTGYDIDDQSQTFANDPFNTFFKSFGESFDGFGEMMDSNGFHGMMDGINCMMNGSNKFDGFKGFNFKGDSWQKKGRSVRINIDINKNRTPDARKTEKTDKTRKAEEKKKDPPVFNDLDVTLKELYTGATKKLKITRNINTGKGVRQETEILTIDIKPGWKPGTKITFNNKGDINPRSEPSDLIFVVKQHPDDTWEREDNNLVTTVSISKKESRNGFSRTIRTIKNEDVIIDFKNRGIVDTNYVHTISGHGMPIRREGKIIGYGNALIRFKIE